MTVADLVPWIVLATCCVLLVLVVAIFRRQPSAIVDFSIVTASIQGLRDDVDRVERTIRENDSRSFSSAEDRGRALRTEVADAVSRSSTMLVGSVSAVGDAQKIQLESFASVLAASTKALGEDLRANASQAAEMQKAQLDAFAVRLSDGVKVLDDRMEVLRRAVDNKTNDLITVLTTKVDASQEISERQSKSLRDEVGTTLKTIGDDLRTSAQTSSENQKAQLEAFSTLLRDSLGGVDSRLEALRQIVDQKTIDLITTLTSKLEAAQESQTLLSRALREEVGGSLKIVGEELRTTASTAAEQQKGQLDSFATQLTEGIANLNASMESLRGIVDQKITTLTDGVWGRFEAAQQASLTAEKALREEITNSLRLVGEELRTTATGAASQQKIQLDSFAVQLTDGLGALDARMEALRAIVDQKITALVEGITGRFNVAQQTSIDAGRALREEVQTALKIVGDDLRKNSEVAAASQKDSLTEVSSKLGALSDGIALRFEAFREATESRLTEIRLDATTAAKQLREEVTNTLKQVSDDQRENSKRIAEEQRAGLDIMGKRIGEIGESSQQSQEKLRQSVADGLTTLRNENEAKLEQMRQTVDEKLQGTLEKRLGESFTLVSQQLRQVHEGLGDMQKLATGVGDLKRVLTNVKSRGTWGETQLASILEDMLSPDQYLRNVKIRESSNDIVEFCIKIPMLDEHQDSVLLPIDAKFPIEDFERLSEAADNGDVAGVEQASQKLESRFRASAKDISSKYIVAPRTTEYAVMYVPSEGLYAEMVKRPGLVSSITREFNVVVAGPTNLMAILNAVHAVARSVTIQQKAGQIAGLLLKVQSEFLKYGEAVSTAKKRAESTVKAMESLDTRQRAMGRALRGVKSIEGIAASAQLGGPVLDLLPGEASEDIGEEAEDEDLLSQI